MSIEKKERTADKAPENELKVWEEKFLDSGLSNGFSHVGVGTGNRMQHLSSFE